MAGKCCVTNIGTLSLGREEKISSNPFVPPADDANTKISPPGIERVKACLLSKNHICGEVT